MTSEVRAHTERLSVSFLVRGEVVHRLARIGMAEKADDLQTIAATLLETGVAAYETTPGNQVKFDRIAHLITPPCCQQDYLQLGFPEMADY